MVLRKFRNFVVLVNFVLDWTEFPLSALVLTAFRLECFMVLISFSVEMLL